jgi:hypothetical protein
MPVSRLASSCRVVHGRGLGKAEPFAESFQVLLASLADVGEGSFYHGSLSGSQNVERNRKEGGQNAGDIEEPAR